jgi:hypothetical protein
MTKTIHGKVHGRIIELDEDPGIPQGQEVEITLKAVPARQPWGEGLRRCAGALANEWTEEDDRILAEIHQSRQQDSRKELPE